jgi:hypothetical protein
MTPSRNLKRDMRAERPAYRREEFLTAEIAEDAEREREKNL